MADITVRKMNFDFPDDLPLVADPTSLENSMGVLGLSFTLPHLEPYLIRTMRVAVKEATDPSIIEDMRNFSAQEGYHFRNHARLNEIILSKLTPEVAGEMRLIEAEMEADYQEFTGEKSLPWNLAYAEGFEAMTFMMAMNMLKEGFEGMDENWAQLMEWHMAEEIEHRTVTFDAYNHISGKYFFRVKHGLWAQKHFLGYVARFAMCAAKDANVRGAVEGVPQRPGRDEKEMKKQLIRTHFPNYSPTKVEVPESVGQVLQKYSDMIAAA